MSAFTPPDELAEADYNPSPKVWPECECGTAYVLRHCLSLTKGYVWAWQRDCKHDKRKPRPGHRMAAADGYEQYITAEAAS